MAVRAIEAAGKVAQAFPDAEVDHPAGVADGAEVDGLTTDVLFVREPDGSERSVSRNGVLSCWNATSTVSPSAPIPSSLLPAKSAS